MPRTSRPIGNTGAVRELQALTARELAGAGAADRVLLLVAELEQQDVMRWQAETLLRFIVDPPSPAFAAWHPLAEIASQILDVDGTEFWTCPRAELGEVSPSAAVTAGQYADVARLLASERLRTLHPARRTP